MAVTATTVWEVRTTGSDTACSGGFDPAVTSPGTDYSQQAAAQVTYTDLAAPTTTTLTSAGNPFTSAHVGNCINITGGTGFTAGHYTITSVAGSTATVNAACATASSAGGTGCLGGAKASPGYVAGQVVAGNTAWIASGTYVCSSTPNVAGGRPAPAVQPSYWVGYVSTRGDAVLWGTMPSLKASANSMTIFAPGNYYSNVSNLEFDGQNGTYASTIGFAPNAASRAYNCRAKNCGGTGFVGQIDAVFCEAVGCTSAGFNLNFIAFGCWSHGGSSHGFSQNGQGAAFINCAAYGNAGDGFAQAGPYVARGCVSVANGGAGFNVDNATNTLVNCVAYGNTGYGFSTTAARPDGLVLNCAGGSNTAGNFHASDIPSGNKPGFVALTAGPFVSASTGNFAPNAAAGGGAALRNAGLGTFPGALSVSYEDCGAIRHQDPSTTAASFVIGG